MREIQCLLAVALAAVTPPVAIAATGHQVRLTPIEDSFGAGCRLALGLRDNRIVGGMSEYDNPDQAWLLGINGRNYRLYQIRADGYNSVLQNRERTILVNIRALQTIKKGNDPSFPFQKDRVSVSITMNGATSTLTAYQSCAME